MLLSDHSLRLAGVIGSESTDSNNYPDLTIEITGRKGYEE